MDFSASALITSLFVSALGFVLYRYGRAQSRAPQTIIGVVLMVGPYFTGSALRTGILAAVAIVALWWSLRMDW